MHKLSFFLPIVFLTLLAACGNDAGKRSRAAQDTGLKAEDYDRLLNLNRMQQDMIDAREVVFMVTPDASLSEKVQKISQKIASPACEKKGDVPSNDLTGAINEETIANNGVATQCPIYWYRRRGWTVSEKTMVMTDSLEIRDANFRNDLAPMSMRTLSGSYKVNAGSNVRSVSGVINITNWQTVSYGRVEGTISILSEISGDQGNGIIVVSLQGVHWANTGSLGWKIKHGGLQGVTYRVGNKTVSKEDFDTLFSSYEVDKYMDNALNMK